MRTTLFLAAGLLILVAMFILARLFSSHYPGASTWAVAIFIPLWLAITGANMWVGVNKAGYGVAEELPILLLLFGIPAFAALLIRWRLG